MAEINEKQKWPADKEKYDENYERIFGSKKSKNTNWYKQMKKNQEKGVANYD